MINKLLIQQATELWNSGKTHGEIIHQLGITPEHEFAINCCSGDLNADEIYSRIYGVSPGMKGSEIRRVMRNDS